MRKYCIKNIIFELKVTHFHPAEASQYYFGIIWILELWYDPKAYYTNFQITINSSSKLINFEMNAIFYIIILTKNFQQEIRKEM